jgi:hypothetical protein
VVADEPHRIDRLVGWTRGDHHDPTLEVAAAQGGSSGEHRPSLVGDLIGLGHASEAFVAVRERTDRRTDEAHAAFA